MPNYTDMFFPINISLQILPINVSDVVIFAHMNLNQHNPNLAYDIQMAA